MDSVTQQNAALVEQAAAAAASLEDQTRQLKDIVGHWQIESAAVKPSASVAAARLSGAAPRVEPAPLKAESRNDSTKISPEPNVARNRAVNTNTSTDTSKSAATGADASKAAAPATAARKARATTADDGDWETF
jgi:methyl-accepting chemotaxis protein-1 (serine sensor receptor)